MPKEYQLNAATLVDIINKIPKEKWDECVEEIKALLHQTSAVHDLVKATADLTGISVADLIQFPEEIKWVDDGLGENKISVSSENDEDGSLEFIFGKENK